MMALGKKMTDPESGTAPGWRWLRIAGLSIGLIFLIGLGAGFIAAHVERGGGFGLVPALVAAAITLAIMLCCWRLLRNMRLPPGEEPLTSGERKNRNLLIGSGLLGFAIAMAMMVAGGGDPSERIFSNAPLPPGFAAVLVLIIAVIVPALSLYWHRVIDEQEADAVKTATMVGMYAYWTLTPAWWLAWRGGFAPAPDGFIIFYVTIAVVGVIWTWKKYH